MIGTTGGNTVFATNLRRLCDTATSIADICRDTGINRQQFNKYLAGRSIPSARVMRKICNRLGVSEDALLGSGTTQPSIENLHLPKPKRIGKELDRLVRQVFPSSQSVGTKKTADLPAGDYFAHFPFPGFSDFVLRSYLHFWRQDEMLFFTRLTRVNAPTGQGAFTARGRHLGIVVPSGNDFSLIGRNRSFPHQASMITVDPKLYQQRYYVGLAITHAAASPVACRTVIEKISHDVPRREILRMCGVIALNNSTIAPFTRATFGGRNPGVMLELPDADKIIGSMAMLHS